MPARIYTEAMKRYNVVLTKDQRDRLIVLGGGEANDFSKGVRVALELAEKVMEQQAEYGSAAQPEPEPK